jgi:retron-type reverse transcriptase
LRFNLQFGQYGYVVEADIMVFFDDMDHAMLLRMLKERIDDAAFLNLIREWLEAGVLETDGKVVHPALLKRTVPCQNLTIYQPNDWS